MSRDVLSRPAPEGRTVPYGQLPDQVVEYWDGGADGLVVFLHGGFWRAEYDRAHVRPLCNDLVARGYTVAAVEYRRTSTGVLGWPSTFDDVAAGVAAVPELLGAQGMPVVLAGHSAGGHLALWAAARDVLPGLAGVLALAPVADLRAAYEDDLDGGAALALLGGSPARQPERYAAADPMGLPCPYPAVLVHGDADEWVPVTQSRDYVAAKGHDAARLVELPGCTHFEVIDPESGVWGDVTGGLAALLA